MGLPEPINNLLKCPKILKDIYSDLAKPGVTEVGKALGTVLAFSNTLLLPVEFINEAAKINLKKNLEQYRKKIEEIPKEKIIEVRPEIGVPILEKMSYVSDKEICDLYTTLLAKASSSDTVNQAHPSFVNIINNLSPDEASLLQFFMQHTDIPDLPFIAIHIVLPHGGFLVAHDLLTGIETKIKIKFPDNIPAYLSNLAGLGILDIRRDTYKKDERFYTDLEKIYAAKMPKLDGENPPTLKIKNGKIEATQYGKLFLLACKN